jgi:hypothetical protein
MQSRGKMEYKKIGIFQKHKIGSKASNKKMGRVRNFIFHLMVKVPNSKTAKYVYIINIDLM